MGLGDLADLFGGSVYRTGPSALVIVLIVLGCLVAAGLHVLMALGLYEVGKRSPAADKAFLAWIPVANLYLLGLLVPDMQAGKMKLNQTSWYLVALYAVLLLPLIPFVGFWLALLGIYAAVSLASMPIFKQVSPQNATLLAFLHPVGFFIIRGKVMGKQPKPYPAPHSPPPYGQPGQYPPPPQAQQPQQQYYAPAPGSQQEPPAPPQA